MADPLNLKHDDALARIQGTLVGPDQKTTLAIVALTPEGVADRGRVVEADSQRFGEILPRASG